MFWGYACEQGCFLNMLHNLDLGGEGGVMYILYLFHFMHANPVCKFSLLPYYI